MPKEITDDDLELLSELGVDAEVEQSSGSSAREQRIRAGFEEIQRFVKENGRLPEHGEDRDIFERIYAVRLDCIRRSPECRAALANADGAGLIGADPKPDNESVAESLSDEDILAELGVEEGGEADISRLVHVRSREEIKSAEEVARRNPCKDFDKFRPLFKKVQEDLSGGQRRTVKYAENADVNEGDLFILHGQKVLVASAGELFVSDYGRPDKRLRVIFDNGTESDLLVRSLQRALNKDKTSRRITDPSLGPLFSSEEEEDDLPTGHIYVLRSKADHPFIAENRTVVHKIGVTGRDVKHRIANAKKDPTYLLSEVEIVASFKLGNINRRRLESLLHRFFAPARIDFDLQDRLGFQVEPKEWFLVPLPVIEEAIQKLIDGTIEKFSYDPEEARVVQVDTPHKTTQRKKTE
jgi:hypothetical protein